LKNFCIIGFVKRSDLVGETQPRRNCSKLIYNCWTLRSHGGCPDPELPSQHLALGARRLESKTPPRRHSGHMQPACGSFHQDSDGIYAVIEEVSPPSGGPPLRLHHEENVVVSFRNNFCSTTILFSKPSPGLINQNDFALSSEYRDIHR
jgi:hypothetical protein